MPTVYDPITSSSYLDFTGYRITNQPDVESAYGISSSNVTVATSASINVAIVLDRVQDPTALLAENWAERQQTLAQLNNTGTLWTTYGADQNQFTAIEQSLASNFHLTVLDGTNSNYVTSAQSRTIWVELNSAADFNNLFNTTLYQYTDPHHAGNDFVFWNGNLSLPQGWNVQGLWFDTESVPLASNYTPGVSVTLAQGYQGIGNGSSLQPGLAAQDIAALYNFPLQGLGVQTGMVGLAEPGIGSALPSGQTQTFQQLLTAYLAHVGENGSSTVYVQGANGQLYAGGDAGERSLDVGVVSAINPNSNIGLYNGSGNNGNADASTFTALQSAIWDTLNNPGVISNSFGDDQSMTPGSPFYAAYAQLFIDAALRNQTVFTALGDGGSGNETANGLTNLEYNVTSPYTVLVGGTSISSFTSAQQDPTINTSIVASALAGNLPTIWQLVEGGLTSLPADAAQLQTFVETVWNQYFVQGAHITGGGYQANWTSSGGVDPTQSTPSYQVDYGLSPVTADPLAQPGRGAPDVAADAGGNTNYVVPNSDMVGTSLSGGTSAASPLWASLTVQLNTIFHDQGLPNLGYMNDLLYIAAVIAPASFNDVTLGTNTSSFVLGGPYESGGHAVTPTGFGFNAGPGYDYASGLGTPNGLQLARTLTDIAHSEMWFGAIPDVIDSNGAGGWTSGADQSLLFQTTSDAVTQVGVHTGPDAFGFFSAASGSFA